MNIKNFTSKDENLTKEIDRVLSLMSGVHPTSNEYADLMETLTKLTGIKETSSKNRVSKDTLAVIAGNLAGIVMIIKHEQVHVITSKALGFVMKAR